MRKKLLFTLLFLVGISSIFATSIGWGNLQWPFSISITQGETTENIYGKVWMEGVTDGVGEGFGITAELGYGTSESTPDETWTWLVASYFNDDDNNDQYIYNLLCDMSAGTYDYTYRYQYDGDSDYYYASEIGGLTVNSEPAPTYDVTFQVDMQYQTISGDGVFLAGSMNGWDPTVTQMTAAAREDIFEVTLQLESAHYEYKFVNGSTWESTGNRLIDTPGENYTIPSVFFNDFGGGTSQEVTVSFQINMITQLPITSVHIAGDFNGWTSTDMIDLISNNVYYVNIVFPAGSDYDQEFKFIKDVDNWEGINNRQFTIDDANSTQELPIYFWDDIMPIPSNLIVEVNQNNIMIAWDEILGATGYNIYRGTTPDNISETPLNPTLIVTWFYIDELATLEGKYFYKVKAVQE